VHSLLTFRPNDLENIFRVLSVTSGSRNKSDCGENILAAMSKLFSADKSIFFLQREEDPQKVELVARNITSPWIDIYMRTLSHDYNPFQMIHRASFRGHVVDLRRLVFWRDFHRTEFYDFLHSQRIGHDRHIYLGSKTQPEAVIALFKTQNDRDFSKQDLGLMRLLVPYLYEAVKNVGQFVKLQVERDIYRSVSQNLLSGVIILDCSMKIMHMNEKAREVLGMPDGFGIHRLETTHSDPSILITAIKEDCALLRKYMEDNLHQIAPFPRSRILDLRNERKYALSCRVLMDNLSVLNYPLYMVQIRELGSNTTGNKEVLKNTYGLTDREIEILENICNGFTNLQIATKLFISEITVKKHIQHIFDKVGVNSRTNLMRKVINSF
jgi:DNA-binding NarL/FixJ family response regulator